MDGEGKQTGGSERTYGMADLRYDLKAGRLEIVKTRKELGQVPPKPEGLASNASAKRSRDANQATTDAPIVKRARRVEVKNEAKEASLVATSVRKGVKKESSGATDASASAVVV